MSNLDPTLFVLRLKQTLSAQGIDYRRLIDEFGQVRASEEREQGKEFGLRDHVRSLVLSLLSSQRPWGPIAQNLDKIATIFLEFDPDAINATTPAQFVQQLLAIRCGNRQIERQMTSLRLNIAVFENIQSKYGSLDRFVESKDPHDICKHLSDTRSPYKLRGVGYALAMEYLRNVGIRASKPDVHVRRAIACGRLGLVDAELPSEEQAYRTVGKIANDAGINATYLDNLLWLFCAKNYGNVCGAVPRCAVCFLSDSCNYGVAHRADSFGTARSGTSIGSLTYVVSLRIWLGVLQVTLSAFASWLLSLGRWHGRERVGRTTPVDRGTQ